MNNHISINLDFDGITLPLIKKDKLTLVPLKPISDLFGINWRRQREKMNGEWQKELFATCLMSVKVPATPISRPDNGAATQTTRAENDAADPTCRVHMPPADPVSRGDIIPAGQAREMMCIRLDRVEAFLFSINPEKVRAAGNVAAADYLKSKIKQWSDLIHEFEQHSGTYSKEASKSIVDRSRRLKNIQVLEKSLGKERCQKLYEQILQEEASDLGVELPVSK